MIRKLNINDYDEFCRVRLIALKQNPVAYSSMAKDFLEAPRSLKLKLLEQSSYKFITGFFKEKTLLGIMGLQRSNRESVSHKANLWGFYVTSDYQTQGIGEKILRSTISSAQKIENLKYLRLVVATKCSPAIRLFEKCGFKKYGIEIDSITDGAQYFDQKYMKLEF